MNSPNTSASPKFKNFNLRPKQSPQEIKERIRKNYKTKIQSCRDVLFDRFRGKLDEKNLYNKITDIYNSMFNFSEEAISEEENEVLEELRKELVQEEMHWWINEYEKSGMENIDWSLIEQDNDVICPVCKKENLKLINEILSCSNCDSMIKTDKPLTEIKRLLFNIVEQHNTACSIEAQYTLIPDPSGTHMYLICVSCNEMKLII